MPPRAVGRAAGHQRELPPPLKRFREGAVEESAAGDRTPSPRSKIAFPPDRAEIEVDDAEDGGVTVKAEGGALPLTWLLDGAAHRLRSGAPRGRAAGRPPRLLPPLRDRRPRPHRPGHYPAQVSGAGFAPGAS